VLAAIAFYRSNVFDFASLERFRAKWTPVRVKKTRQNKKLEPGSDLIRTDQALHLLARSTAKAQIYRGATRLHQKK
jgi:hypothetical protein